MIFFTADTHFGHHNIIKYCNRPFYSLEEMDDTIINNWNSIVSLNDTVYHLGDFAWKSPEKYKNQLNGNIILIKGNHDWRFKRKAFDNFFQVYDFGLITKINNITFTLCHYSMRTWHKSHFGSLHLYGHSHGCLFPYKKSFDVGVDANDFFPININQILKIMENL